MSQGLSDPAATTGRRAAGDVAVQLVGTLANLALGVGVTVLVVRTLGVSAYGQWTTIFAVTLVAASFGELGLETVATGQAAANPAVAPSWIGALLAVRGALAIPVAAGAAGVLLILSTSESMRVAGVVIALTMLLSPFGSLRVIFRLRIRNDRSILLTTFNSLVWGAAVAVIAVEGGGMVPLAVAFTGSMALTVALQAFLALRMGSVDFRRLRERARSLVAIGLPVSVAGLLVTGYVRIDQILVFDLAGPRSAGLYAASYRILDQAQFVPVAVMTTLYPVIAASYPSQMGRVRSLTQQAAEYLLMVSLPALAFVIVEGSPLMVALFGRSFAPSGPALALLLGAYVAIALGHLVGGLRILLDIRRRFVAYAAAGLVVNVALNVALIPAYGFVAAAAITVVTEVLVLGLTGRAVLSKLGFRPRFSRLARIAGAAALLGLLLWALREVGGGLVALSIVTVLVYPALLFSSRALTVGQIRVLVGGQSIKAP